jgi:hypothetical protein
VHHAAEPAIITTIHGLYWLAGGIILAAGAGLLAVGIYRFFR